MDLLVLPLSGLDCERPNRFLIQTRKIDQLFLRLLRSFHMALHFYNISDNAMSSGAMTLFALLGWVIAFSIAVGPVVGWNRYMYIFQ